MTKRILFFIGNLNLSGGTERVAIALANHLHKSGATVQFLSLWAGDRPFFPLDGGIEIRALNNARLKFSKGYCQQILKLRKAIEDFRPDSIIDVEVMLALYSAPALIGKKIRHISWEHFNFNVDLGLRLRRLARQLVGCVSDDIVVLTDRDRELWCAGLIYRRAKITRIYNMSPIATSGHTPSMESRTFLSVGRLTYQKGYDLLLRAWKYAVNRMPAGWKLVIVGEGEDRGVLENFIKDNGLSASVELVGSKSNVSEYYLDASYYVMSSRFEGLPMVLIEAQGYGLPSLSFDIEMGPREIIMESEAGFLVGSGDAEMMADGLVMLSKLDADSYRHMSTRAKKSAERFESSAISRLWCEFLDL